MPLVNLAVHFAPSLNTVTHLAKKVLLFFFSLKRAHPKTAPARRQMNSLHPEKIPPLWHTRHVFAAIEPAGAQLLQSKLGENIPSLDHEPRYAGSATVG